MPGGKSCERRRLDPPAPTRLSPAEDRGARCSSHQALLLVVELDVRLVQQRDREVEREVAVRALEEREARVPAMQVAVQGDHVLSTPGVPGAAAGGAPAAAPRRGARPSRRPIPAIVVGVTENEAARFVRNGSNFAVSTPA